MQPLGYVAIAFIVLLVGGALTLASKFVQLRGLIDGSKAGGPDRDLRRALLASSVGAGSIAGAALALTAGGPGALAWMWVATLLGMAITYAEVDLAVRSRGKRGDTGAEAGPTTYMRNGAGGLGKLLAVAYALSLPLTALTVGALFQAQQTAQLLLVVAEANPITVGAVMATVAGALMFIKGAGARKATLLLVPVAVVAYVIVAGIVVLSDTEALSNALSAIFGGAEEGEAMIGGAAGGTVMVALQHGFLRATFATESGLGTAASADEILDASDGRRAGRAAMLAPLVSGGVVATLSGLAIMVSGVSPRQEVAERNAEGQVQLLALERPQARGLIPSLERGQVIVLPEDTELQAQHRYPFVMRANPRGSQVGNFSAEENAIAVPVWAITQNVDTIVFRSADPERRLNSAYDRRIPVKQERRALPNDVEAIVLTPVDESLDLAELRKRMRGPYVQLEDFYFEGGVADATHPRYGDHLAMFEDRPPNAPENPVLRSVISFGFRGPYFYSSADAARPPSGMIGVEGLDFPVGRVLDLRMEAPPRGTDLGSILDETGEYQTPGWAFLQGTEHAVLRHLEDPAQDLVVPVQHTVADDGTLRFTSAAPEIVDFAKAKQMKAFTGPYLLPPPYEFQVEVHSSARLSDEWSDRVSLVPLHPQPEPQGGGGAIYDPHPGELFLTDMRGPFLVHEGAALVASAVDEGVGGTGTFALAAIVFVLAVTTAVAWASSGARALSSLLGGAAGPGVKLAVLAALVVGATSGLETVLSLAEPLLLITLAINGVALLLLLPKTLAKN